MLSLEQRLSWGVERLESTWKGSDGISNDGVVMKVMMKVVLVSIDGCISNADILHPH